MMMLYKNKKTGAVIKSACKISGGGWELVKAVADKGAGDASAEKATAKTSTEEKTAGKTASKTAAKGKK